MQRILSCCALGVLLLASGEARPCGGAFGQNYTIQPTQKIVVSYRNGVETYVFNPYFCGQASTFGIILPVPSALAQNPALSQSQIYTDLGKIAAPIIQTQNVCASNSGGTRATGGAASSSVGGSAGVSVIQRGQVGIFDWALLQATSTASFTDWLTTNGFPYAPGAASVFTDYVTNHWYFVAFKVSTDASSGTGGSGSVGGSSSTSTRIGSTICGNVGPISLSFPSTPQAVIPARIATVSSTTLTWTIYALASQQMRMQNYYATLQFSGAIGDAEMSTYPSLSSLTQSGDRLTELFVSTTSSGLSGDLFLEPDPNQADYRRTEIHTVQVPCTGGYSGTGGTTNSLPNTALGGTAGEFGAGGTPATGGAVAWATGGVLAVAVGGNNSGGASGTETALTTGGVAVTASSTPTGGANAVTGGAAAVVSTLGGAPATGGKANIGGAPDLGGNQNAPAAGSRNDDGGCSVAHRSRSTSGSAAGLALALLWLRKRLRRRH